VIVKKSHNKSIVMNKKLKTEELVSKKKTKRKKKTG